MILWDVYLASWPGQKVQTAHSNAARKLHVNEHLTNSLLGWADVKQIAVCYDSELFCAVIVPMSPAAMFYAVLLLC